ncbi:Regulatory protein soxS [Kingella potus]|uniref:Regulatory protein soxS n=1 Tax=Kingella potus TaxID=265175 RepID=A0A377R269_9NEIS|nr:AraC family transcriptional regulator [Kingella potus]UOP00739.1 AraC family transcriptional regulator [Kingella potus]STR02857.1 Regulatory protein soxS [Kingella potus]
MDMLDRLVSLAQICGSVEARRLLPDGSQIHQEARRGRAWIYIIGGGSGRLQTDGAAEPRLLREGDIVFFPHGSAHTLAAGGTDAADFGFFCARFSYDAHADLMAGLPETVLLNMRGTSLRHVAALLQAEADNPQPGARSAADALAKVILVMLLRAFLTEKRVPTLHEGVLKGLRNRRLHDVIRDVLEQPAQPWTIGDMAGSSGMSPAQLARLFKIYTGTSPYSFVNRIRLQHAAVRLKHSAEPAFAIAQDAGFGSETHFCKAFKKMYGITPGQYRKRDGCDTANGTPAPPEAV